MTNYDDIIFKSGDSLHQPVPGSLLIAQPYLDDKPFKHSVVLVTELGADDTYTGFVMNKRSDYTLADLFDVSNPDADLPLYCGGPVSTDHLFFVHTLNDIVPGGIPISGNLYFGGNFESLLSYINSGFEFHDSLRFFLGYSGWGVHQLSEEIKANFWAVSPRCDTESLFRGSGDSYWHRCVRLLGDEFRNWRYHPINPQSN